MLQQALSNKSVKYTALLLAGLLSQSLSFADVLMQSNSTNTFNGGSANIAWSDAEAKQLLSSDIVKGSSQNTTTLTKTSNSAIPPNANWTNQTLNQYYPTTVSFQTNANSSQYSTYPTPNYSGNANFGSFDKPLVNARAAIVMDSKTGEILYSKNTDSVYPIASVTKLMTAVITADAHLDMSELITLEPIDFAGSEGKNSSSTLRVGDTLNRAEVLLVALMKSENPAAAALARTYPAGRSAFIAAMNAKAKQLGMTSTHYVESTGLNPHNVSTARDLAKLVATAAQYGVIRQFSTTAHYQFDLGRRVLSSNNTNALVREGLYPLNLSKTGYISEAGRCVVMETTVNQRPAAIVLLGASTSEARTNDATNLISWVTRNSSRTF